MNLKLRGLTWVGDMCQKFEAVCHDVDEIVKEDTVKYVENRVQTVGESMKRFYSGLVQDILPPSAGHVKHDTQYIDLKQNVAYTSSEMIKENKDNLVDTDTRKSSVEPYVTDSENEQLSGTSCSSALHFVNELDPVPSMDLIECSDSYPDLGQDLLPPAGHVKQDGQYVDLKENVAYISSSEALKEIKDSPMDFDTRKSSVKSCLINSEEKQLSGTSCSGALHCLNELNPGPSMEPYKGSDSYSGLVQGALPPVGHVKHDAQCVDLKKNVSYSSSLEVMKEIKDNPVDSDTGKPSVELYLNEKLSGTPCLNELIPAPSTDPIDEPDLYSTSTQNDDVLVNENSDIHVEEYVTENHPSSSDIPESPFPRKACFSEELFFSGPSNKKCENLRGILPIDSPATSIYDTGFNFHQLEASSCDKLVNGVEIPSDDLSGIRSSESSSCTTSFENRPAEVTSSSTSLFTESLCLPENSATDILPNIEDLSCKAGENDAPGCNSHISQSPQFPLATFGGNEVAETTRLASSCSTMSNDLDSFHMNGEASSAECSKNVREQSRDSYEIGAFRSSLELVKSDDPNDIIDPNMEAIDLCDKVERVDSCIIMGSSVPCALSCRVPKLKSYKKKFLEAFASRKRLIKEYELLAILYGDIELECSQSTKQSTLCPSTLPSDLKELPMNDSIDCGWELV